MSRSPSISAVLPAYNEVAVIADVARRTWEALRQAGGGEVVVVDDGSNDGTGDAVTALAAGLDGIRLETHAVNRGYGAALRTGFAAARGDLVFLMDADGQFDPADLPLLLPGADLDTLVAGYRAHRRDPLSRRLSNAAFFAVARAAVGPLVRDPNCAFKLFPRSLGLDLECEGAMISSELILRARRRGLRIVEVAVPHHPRTAGRATGADPQVVLRAFAELRRLRRSRVDAAVEAPRLR